MNTDSTSRFTVCPADKTQVDDLANLVVMAGDGLPLLTWDAMREADETAMDVGRRRAARTEGAFSYRNADVVKRDDKVLSAIVSYPLLDATLPESLDEIPPVFRPLVELESKAVPSWYINVLASYPDVRRQGAASALLTEVETRARGEGFSRLSLITADVNPARSLYEKHGFSEVDRAAMVKDGLDFAGQEWVLMTKTLAKSKPTVREN